MNKVMLTGRLVRDPELKEHGENKVTKFSLAVTRQFKRDEADFINCVAFGKTAETMAQYLLKGSQIGVTGNIRTGSYDAQDGSKRFTTDVVVENFEFLGGKNSDGNNSNNIYDNNNGDFDNSGDFEPVDDGDCPF